MIIAIIDKTANMYHTARIVFRDRADIKVVERQFDNLTGEEDLIFSSWTSWSELDKEVQNTYNRPNVYIFSYYRSYATYLKIRDNWQNVNYFYLKGNPLMLKLAENDFKEFYVNTPLFKEELFDDIKGMVSKAHIMLVDDILTGRSRDAIAIDHHYSENSVGTIITRLIQRFGVKNIHELARVFIDRGILDRRA